jgi:hypothetical protein
VRHRSDVTLIAAGLCLLGVVSNSVAAQQCKSDCPSSNDSARMSTHVLPALGVRAGTPQKASVALGIVAGVDWQDRGRDYSHNVAVFVEPGVGAARASIAYVNAFRNFGSGFGVAATALRSWDDPWTVVPNSTYAGAEVLVWPIFLAGPRIGLFRRLRGNPSAGRWFVSFDLGFGV